MSSTFGVTYALVQYEFSGVDLSGMTTEVTSWIAAAGAKVDQYLIRLGFDEGEVEGYGSTDRAYIRAQEWIVHLVAARVASAITHRDPDKAQLHRELAAEIETEFREMPETTTPNFDENDQIGTFGGNVRMSGARRGDIQLRRPTIRRGMKI